MLLTVNATLSHFPSEMLFKVQTCDFYFFETLKLSKFSIVNNVHGISESPGGSSRRPEGSSWFRGSSPEQVLAPPGL
jgi:hypothetical protein